MKYLTNIDFVLWCLRGCPSSTRWASYVKSHSDDEQLNRALRVMRRLRVSKPKMSGDERQQLYDSILADSKATSAWKRRVVRYLRHASVGLAACFVVGVVVFALNRLNTTTNPPQQSLSLSQLPMTDHIRVLCGDNTYDYNTLTVARICCNQSGAVSVNEQMLEGGVEQDMNIVIPKAHRAILTLSDNTKVWINGNTKLRVGEFTDHSRSVEIDGEAYFEVAHNPEAPFVVYGSTLNTTVKGTSFNVYTTSDTSATHYVVLVEGSVEVDMPSLGESVTLTPSQIINYNNDCYMTTQTDVSRYIGWRDGTLTIDSDSVAQVALQLAEYYGVEVECDSNVSNLSCSGRLVLFDDINQTMTVLESIIPINYVWYGEKLYISLGNK